MIRWTVRCGCDKAAPRFIRDKSSIRYRISGSTFLAGKGRETFVTGRTEKADDILSAEAKVKVPTTAINAWV